MKCDNCKREFDQYGENEAKHYDGGRSFAVLSESTQYYSSVIILCIPCTDAVLVALGQMRIS